MITVGAPRQAVLDVLVIELRHMFHVRQPTRTQTGLSFAEMFCAAKPAMIQRICAPILGRVRKCIIIRNQTTLHTAVFPYQVFARFGKHTRMVLVALNRPVPDACGLSGATPFSTKTLRVARTQSGAARHTVCSCLDSLCTWRLRHDKVKHPIPLRGGGVVDVVRGLALFRFHSLRIHKRDLR